MNINIIVRLWARHSGLTQAANLKGVKDLNTKENLESLFSTAENAAERLWEFSLVALGSIAWNQEQIENFIKKCMDQNKIARDESTRLVEETFKQAKRNQQQLQKMIHDSVVGAFGKLDIPTFNYYDELSRKVDELSKKVANL